MSGPLDGVKVLDLTRILAGPYCTMVLGDLGADVIKIERLPDGDDSRQMAPFTAGESYCFAQVNRNKRSLALDLKDERGLKVLLALARECDVVVENFRPGIADRLGCGYSDLRACRPDVIYCSISGFGQDGPYAMRPAYDIITQGMSGFMQMTGHPGSPPARMGIALNDIAGGVTAVQAILAAHIARLKGGDGQYIDVSLLESAMAWTVWEAAAMFGSGEEPRPTGTRHRRSAPYQAFRTADGHVTIGANTEAMWDALCSDVLCRPDLAQRECYANSEQRLAHVEELEADIEFELMQQPTRYWVDRLLAAGIPAGPVYDYSDAVRDEHLTARGFLSTVDHPAMGPLELLSSPLRLSSTPPTIRRPAPRFGEHSRELLIETGFSAEFARQLEADGVVHDAACQAEDPR